MTEPAQAKPDVEDLNIAAYERVFAKALDAAARLEPKITMGTKDRDTRVLQIGTAIFRQFFTDQGNIQQAQRNAEAMVKGISGVMDGRTGQ